MSFAAILFTLLLIFQAGLVVTGGAVRLTGSGLGCPTWPECTDGSIAPIVNQAQGPLHAWIEFGNRLIAWVIFFLAIAALIYVVRKFKSHKDYKRLRLLALLQILGFLGQVVLGGITVLTKLHPISVSAHFVLTIPLIAGALSLRRRVLNRPVVLVAPVTRLLIKIVTVVGFMVLVLGTLVTGTGPHSGDENSRRYSFDERTISWIHADLVIAFVFLTIALYFVVKVSESAGNQKYLSRYILVLLIVSLSQGIIGYIQYFTGLPILLVGSHLLGATLVWIATWRINLAGRDMTDRNRVNA